MVAVVTDVLDLGAPYSDPDACCQVCKAGDRPLWSTPGDDGLIACATCWARRNPGRLVRFASGGRVVVASQETLL